MPGIYTLAKSAQLRAASTQTGQPCEGIDVLACNVWHIINKGGLCTFSVWVNIDTTDHLKGMQNLLERTDV